MTSLFVRCAQPRAPVLKLPALWALTFISKGIASLWPNCRLFGLHFQSICEDIGTGVSVGDDMIQQVELPGECGAVESYWLHPQIGHLKNHKIPQAQDCF